MAAAAVGMGNSLRSEERAVLTTALAEVREHSRRLEVALAEAQGARATALAANERAGEELKRVVSKHALEVESLGARLAAATSPATAIMVEGEAYDAKRVLALRTEAAQREARVRAAEEALETAREKLVAMKGFRMSSAAAAAEAGTAELEAMSARCREAEQRGAALEAALAGSREQVRLLNAQLSAANASVGGGVSHNALLELTASLRQRLDEQIALTEAATANVDASRLQVAESEAKLALSQQSKAELAHRAARAVRDVQKQAEALAALSLTLKTPPPPLSASTAAP